MRRLLEWGLSIPRLLEMMRDGCRPRDGRIGQSGGEVGQVERLRRMRGELTRWSGMLCLLLGSGRGRRSCRSKTILAVSVLSAEWAHPKQAIIDPFSLRDLSQRIASLSCISQELHRDSDSDVIGVTLRKTVKDESRVFHRRQALIWLTGFAGGTRMAESHFRRCYSRCWSQMNENACCIRLLMLGKHW
jgi:hypothetical protein